MPVKTHKPACALALLLLLAALAGCVSLSRSTAPSPDVAWTPPPSAEKKPVPLPPAEIPPELIKAQQTWTLGDLLDVGLRNNTQTRAAWQSARAAAAALGIAESAFFPRLSFDLTASKTKGAAIGGRFTFDFSDLNPALNLTYTIFNFGLSAGLEIARQSLFAANFTQNAVLQSVILSIEQDYYLYLATKALLAVQETSVKEAQANLEAADVRHKAGVATIADVLQARTALSSAELNLISTRGQILTQKGALATSLGLPADTNFEVVDEMPATLPLDTVSGEVDRYIAQAQAQRPDLAAARAQALEAQARIGYARADGLPSISLTANAGRTYYNIGSPTNNYTASIVLDIPLFKGLQVYYGVLQAKAEADVARTQMKSLEQTIVLAVWTSYYNLATAAQRIKTAQDLLASAEQSQEVSLTSYKRGVNSILDLLAAENSLASGRVQLIQAQSDWLMSLVQFEHDTGTLGPPSKSPLPAAKGEHRP